MPCDSIRTVTVDLQVADEGVLVRALKARGFTVDRVRPGLIRFSRENTEGTIRSGQIEMEDDGYSGNVQQRADAVAAEVKQAYAKEAVKTAAKKYGWTFTQDAKQANHVTISKRAF